MHQTCVFCIVSSFNGVDSITQYCEEHLLAADECVQEIRATVFRETNLTVSAGIAPNKVSGAYILS